MRYLLIVCVFVFGFAAAVAARLPEISVAIDFEEQPSPDLSKINNIYHGGAKYVYAFLVIKRQEGSMAESHVSAYDIGYRLISPDQSVVNHGFYRLAGWRSLDAGEVDFPMELNLPGAPVPTSIGYWKLELKKGRRSRGEFQLVPNPANRRPAVTLVAGDGEIITFPDEELSQDVRCHGLINRTFCFNEPYDLGDTGFAPGEVIARFMPGVIEMDGRFGGIDDIADPGLRQVAEDFHLAGVKRLFRNAQKNPGPVLSRTGRLFTPIDTWDVYLLNFPENTDLAIPLNAIRALPRCVYAEPNEFARPTSCTHVPNDSLASEPDSWHLYRIGMPCAWDQEIGDTTVHIGVVDGGVDYHVKDFGAGKGAGKKVAGGYDYAMDDDDPRVEWGDDCEEEGRLANHGNWMHSTVGALTNNDSIGVAGIAGGWGGEQGELGPSIFHFKIREDDCGYYRTDAMANAINDAYPVYGCHILTISVRKGYSSTLKERIRDFHNYGGVVVATFDNSDQEASHYPANYRNDWILCAQGSSRHPIDETDSIPERRISADDPLYTWGADWPKAYWPIPVLSTDVSAPASHMCIIYADSLVGKKPYYKCSAQNAGVSYAPPQVAGVAALMLAKNDTLSVYDLEGLISASCTDITSDYEELGSLPGWDKYTGWGRINADSCLMFADPSHPCQFTVQHFAVSGGGVIVDSSATLELTEFKGDGPIVPGFYYAQRFEVRRAVSPPSGYKFLWGRPCEGAGWGWTGRSPGYDPINFQEPYCDLVPSTQYAPTCTLFSYVYEVWNWEQDSLLGVYPALADSLDWAYAALYQGIPAAILASEDDVLADRLRILSAAPNPSKGEVLISFQLPVSQRVTVKVYDVRGREVRTILDEKMEAGTHEKKWDGRNNSGKAVVPGVYMCRVNTGDQWDVKKMLLLREGGK